MTDRKKFAAIGLTASKSIDEQPMSKDNLLLIREARSQAYAVKYMGSLATILELADLRGFDWFYVVEIPSQ